MGRNPIIYVSKWFSQLLQPPILLNHRMHSYAADANSVMKGPNRGRDQKVAAKTCNNESVRKKIKLDKLKVVETWGKI